METSASSTVKRIGEYLGCDAQTLKTALARQEELRQKGEKRLLGELLAEEGVVSREDLNHALLRQRVDRLRRVSIFSRLTGAELERIAEWLSEVSIDPGEEFIVQDSPGDCFFLLIEGEAVVCEIEGSVIRPTLLCQSTSRGSIRSLTPARI